jgi:hypothetical protein
MTAKEELHEASEESNEDIQINEKNHHVSNKYIIESSEKTKSPS